MFPSFEPAQMCDRLLEALALGWHKLYWVTQDCVSQYLIAECAYSFVAGVTVNSQNQGSEHVSLKISVMPNSPEEESGDDGLCSSSTNDKYSLHGFNRNKWIPRDMISSKMFSITLANSYLMWIAPRNANVWFEVVNIYLTLTGKQRFSGLWECGNLPLPANVENSKTSE